MAGSVMPVNASAWFVPGASSCCKAASDCMWLEGCSRGLGPCGLLCCDPPTYRCRRTYWMFCPVFVQDLEKERLKDEGMDEGAAADEAVVEDGEGTDAESDNSNEDLNVHHFLAELEAEFDKLHGQADLDHTDDIDFALQEEEEGDEETLGQEDFEETLGMLAATGDASDEEKEREPSDAEAVLPPPPPADMTRRRLRGKQRPPAAYQNAPASAPARKRHGLLKQLSRKIPKPCRTCEGYQERSCRFDPRLPGQAARAHRERNMKTCIFCSPERMQEAHGGSRPAALKICFQKPFQNLRNH